MLNLRGATLGNNAMDPVAQTVSRLTSPRSYSGMTGFQARAQGERDFQLTKELEDRWFLRQQREDQLRKMRQEVMGERDGARAIDRLSQLNPADENYYQQAQAVLAETPEALTDRKVGAFLGLQQATAHMAQRERDYQKQNIFNMNRDAAILQRQEEAAAAHDQRVRENRLAEFERSLALGTREDSEYRIAVKKLGADTFEKREKAMVSALTAKDEWNRYLKALEGARGAPPEEIEGWMGRSEEDGTFRFNEDKYVAFHNKLAVDTAIQAGLAKEIKELQTMIRTTGSLPSTKQRDDDLEVLSNRLRELQLIRNPELKVKFDERKSINQTSANGTAQPNATGSGKPGGKQAVRDARAPDDE